jgi:hypothetical protein
VGTLSFSDPCSAAKGRVPWVLGRFTRVRGVQHGIGSPYWALALAPALMAAYRRPWRSWRLVLAWLFALWPFELIVVSGLPARDFRDFTGVALWPIIETGEFPGHGKLAGDAFTFASGGLMSPVRVRSSSIATTMPRVQNADESQVDIMPR